LSARASGLTVSGTYVSPLRCRILKAKVNRGSLKTALRRRGLPPALQVITTKDAYFWDGMT
jgi:hypothetical protein